MKIKNTGGKIIRLGTLTLLPGEVAALPKDFEDNPVVKHFADMGLVEFEKKLSKSVEPVKTDSENGQQADGEQEPADDSQQTGGEQEPADDSQQTGGEQEPDDDNNGDDGEKPAPKPDTTKTGRGGRNK